MNKSTFALGAVMAITAALALTTMSSVMTRQASAAGTNTTSPCVLAAQRGSTDNSTNSTAGNSTNSTAGNRSHIVKSDLLFSGNNIIKIATNNPAYSGHGSVTTPVTQLPVSSHLPCPNTYQPKVLPT